MELISPKSACQRLGVGRTTLWRMERTGGFPRAITLSTGEKGCAGRKAFIASEIDQWVSARAAERVAS